MTWDAIAGRDVRLARKLGRDTVHSYRGEPRGYGRRRLLWRLTTECGLIGNEDDWTAGPGRLVAVTCETCRRVVQDRYTLYELYGGGAADALLDEYDQLEPWWELERRWHEEGVAE